MKDAIKEIGHEKVVQVITNNANVMKSTRALIKGGYLKIFWTPCVVQKTLKIMKLDMRNVVELHVLLMMHPSYMFLS